MLEGISRVSGFGPTIELNGKKLQIKARLLEQYGKIEAEILKRREDPVTLAMRAIASQNADLIARVAEIRAESGDEEAARFQDKMQELNQKEARLCMSEAYDRAKEWRNVTGEEMRDWLYTFRGTCFNAWLALRDNGPEYTLEHVTNMLVQEAYESSEENVIEKIHTAVDQASGEDLRGNSTGLP